MSKKKEDEIRSFVSQAYAKAVAQPKTSTGCCKGEGPAAKGVVVQWAGYGQELEMLPPDAVLNSFGCGNPLAFSQVKQGDVVVDLGCGAGIDLLIAAHKVGPEGKVIGVDMTEEMIRRARENISQAGLDNVEVRKGFIEDLPLEDCSADWVISNCVINLSPDKSAVFREIYRVLKPGGRVSISDIMVEDLPPEIRDNPTLYSSCVAGAISEEEYLSGMSRAGLEEVQVKERLVYDRSQLRAFIQSELPESGQALACCAQQTGKELGSYLESLLERVEGKVWSAKVWARKPR